MTQNYPHQHRKEDIELDVERHKHSPFLLPFFYVKASQMDWTHSEIEELRDFLHGKPFEEQINILKFYCFIPIVDQLNM